MSSGDTIFALSSGRPPAAIAVIRISGPRAGAALEALTGRIPQPRQAAFARVRDPQSGEVIDEALALWFPAPKSETGEDTAELQVHGGRAVVAAVLAALGKVDGLRPAEAGEFTRRAFENGKLDLTAVEGLADLVAAETEAQRRQALAQMRGLLGNRAEAWRRQLIEALALAEAQIDFSDEADVPEDLLGPALAVVRTLLGEIETALADADRGERLRDGLVVAIAGPPNAGKSTLLNRIARREVAIVSEHAGTTRDVIEVHLDLGGYPVTLLDTAGVRESHDPVEREGVRRARERAAAADLILWVTDGAEQSNQVPANSSSSPVWRVNNKSDLRKADEAKFKLISGNTESGFGNSGNSEVRFMVNDRLFDLSARTGEGVNQLTAALQAFVGRSLDGEPALVGRLRQKELLQQVAADLRLAASERDEKLAERIRLAAAALSRLTGRIDVEDVLDVIFRDFCIGK